jgi:hypothetical protein
VSWVNYYNMAGVNLTEVCEDPVDEALDQMTSYIQAGLSGKNVSLVQTDTIMHGESNLIQAFQAPYSMEQGWPHPNRRGAKAIANLIQP